MYLKALYLELLGGSFHAYIIWGRFPCFARMCFCNGFFNHQAWLHPVVVQGEGVTGEP